ncbi:MAG TPA: alanine racemase [Desulfobacteraceae bacterium]|nr:alanine racemase [Desulfobacteraceae bacterium]
MINSRSSNLTIDLSALVHNLSQIRLLTGQDTKIMGIVKSDAYGHGLVSVSKTLEKNNIDCLGVAHLHEALKLRKNGIKLPIMILCGINTRDECYEVVKNKLSPFLFEPIVIKILSQESMRQGKKTHIYLKIDTGMGRLGIPHDETGSFIESIMPLKGLCLEGLSSHLSSADEPSGNFTETQIRHFEKAIEVGRSMGLRLHFNNLANSAGIMAYRKARFNMVRPGIMLYGGLPSPGFRTSVPLRPVMHFKGQVLQVRDLPGNTPLSYGRTYYTKGPRKTAILSAGYGDGLPRNMSNKGKVLIKGKRVPIVGTICMNITICDITGLKGVKSGDESTFLGSQGKETITGDDIGRWADTISYDIFCSIGQRNIKEY